MNKPNTPLHDRNYPEDWKLWIKEHLKTQEYGSKEQAMKGIMKETRGLINPNWVGTMVVPACGDGCCHGRVDCDWCTIPDDDVPDDLAQAKDWYTYSGVGCGWTPVEAYNDWIKDCVWEDEV